MKKWFVVAAAILVMVAAAGALPSGLSGITLGPGIGGFVDGYIQGEFDFALSPYVCLGPEIGYGFGGAGTFFLGGAGRLYFIPQVNSIAQPHLAFGAGMAHYFDDSEHEWNNENDTGMYFTFAPGCDFEIPHSPVTPYADIGGLFYIGDDSDADFRLEVGIRFSAW